MGIDKSFIGGLLFEDDWYILDIEIYYLETFTYNINGQKNIFRKLRKKGVNRHGKFTKTGHLS